MINVPNDEKTQRLLTSGTRWRNAFLVLAVVVPGVLALPLERQARRLEALADHGQPVQATVESITRDGFATYRYSVGDESYTWSVNYADAPYAVGERFAAQYLPEDPSLTRPSADPALPREEAAANRAFRWKLFLGIFVFWAINAVLAEAKLRGLRQGRGPGLVIAPLWRGRIVALVVLGSAISANFFPEVIATQKKAFGESPFGLPVQVVVSVGEVVLFTPMFWVFHHLMVIATQASSQGRSLTPGGLALFVVGASGRHAEVRRSRNICIAGLIYFMVLVGCWIAFAESRGI